MTFSISKYTHRSPLRPVPQVVRVQCWLGTPTFPKGGPNSIQQNGQAPRAGAFDAAGRPDKVGPFRGVGPTAPAFPLVTPLTKKVREHGNFRS